MCVKSTYIIIWFHAGPPRTGQCVSTNELEGLRYHLYSELTESKKEIDTLRNDLKYWQNTTISILKKYLLDNQGILRVLYRPRD